MIDPFPWPGEWLAAAEAYAAARDGRGGGRLAGKGGAP